MEPVNELDIDGYRWEIKDIQAREDISKLKSDNRIINIGQIDLILKPGYTAAYAQLQHVMKMGKMITGIVHILGLAGEGIGEKKVITVASVPFSPQELFEFVAVDTWRNNSFRMSFDVDKSVHIVSTEKMVSGNTDIIGSFVCFEA